MDRVIIHRIRDVKAEVNFKEEFVLGSNSWGWISLISGQLRLLSFLSIIGVTVPSLRDKMVKKLSGIPQQLLDVPQAQLLFLCSRVPQPLLLCGSVERVQVVPLLLGTSCAQCVPLTELYSCGRDLCRADESHLFSS